MSAPEAASRVMLVTGATDGIGRQTALELARSGARVLLHGRDPGRVAGAVAALRAATKNPHVEGLLADFGSLAHVRRLADEVMARTDRLHVLINNAGVYMKKRQLTEDGIEVTLQVNHVAPFLLTTLLLPLIERSAPARIITLSSVAHARGKIDFRDLNGQRAFDGYKAYAQSKLANVLFTHALVSRLHKTGVTANAVHPGVITTKLLQTGFGMTGSSLEEGAATSVFLALSPTVETVTGKYFAKKQETPPAPGTLDWELAEELWRATERLIAVADAARTA